MDWQAHADALVEHGVVCIPVLPEAKRREWEDRIFAAMDDFPEYRRKGRRVQRVLGGFGALGNPSSFHHPVIQGLRADLKVAVSEPLFRRYTRDPAVRLEVLFDRICVRSSAYGVPTKESWHRDIYNHRKYNLRPLPEDDEIFGGWLNLSDREQRFVGIVGSHVGTAALAAQRDGGGFDTLTDAQIRDQRANERLQAQAGQTYGSVTGDERGHLIVPPGQQLIFFQRLLHSVAGGTQPDEPQLRLFFGHRLTTETAPLFPLDEVIANNAVPHVPSGQIPPMYSQNHYAWFTSADNDKYRVWGEQTFLRQCLFERKVGRTGVVYYTPGSAGNRDQFANTNRSMPSLAAMGFTPYAYTARTRRAMTPEAIPDYGWEDDADAFDADE